MKSYRIMVIVTECRVKTNTVLHNCVTCHVIKHNSFKDVGCSVSKQHILLKYRSILILYKQWNFKPKRKIKDLCIL